MSMRLAVVNHCLMEAPIWNDRKRGKNWAAIIDVDGTAPGGLSRQFLGYGRGDVFFMVEQVALFDALEFAADEVSYSGDVTPVRWYGVVVAKTDDFLEVEQCKTGAAAVVAARAKRTNKADYLKALGVEKAHLTSRATEIDAEIQRVIETPDPPPPPVESPALPVEPLAADAMAPNPLRSVMGPVRSKMSRYTYATHYSGAASWQRGAQGRVQMQAGGALCVTTARALARIHERGNSTRDHAKVTCGRCLELMAVAAKTGTLDPSQPTAALEPVAPAADGPTPPAAEEGPSGL